jgi:hypothetical protein
MNDLPNRGRERRGLHQATAYAPGGDAVEEGGVYGPWECQPRAAGATESTADLGGQSGQCEQALRIIDGYIAVQCRWFTNSRSGASRH